MSGHQKQVNCNQSHLSFTYPPWLPPSLQPAIIPECTSKGKEKATCIYDIPANVPHSIGVVVWMGQSTVLPHWLATDGLRRPSKTSRVQVVIVLTTLTDQRCSFTTLSSHSWYVQLSVEQDSMLNLCNANSQSLLTSDPQIYDSSGLQILYVWVGIQVKYYWLRYVIPVSKSNLLAWVCGRHPAGGWPTQWARELHVLAEQNTNNYTGPTCSREDKINI